MTDPKPTRADTPNTENTRDLPSAGRAPDTSDAKDTPATKGLPIAGGTPETTDAQNQPSAGSAPEPDNARGNGAEQGTLSAGSARAARGMPIAGRVPAGGDAGGEARLADAGSVDVQEAAGVGVRLFGTASGAGWPEAGCRCASCGRMRALRRRVEPTRMLLDGVPLDQCRLRKVPGGYDIRTPGGGRVLYAAEVDGRPEPLSPGSYDAVLLDLIGAPSHLGWLRRIGTVTEGTLVYAVQVDHRIASPAELDRRLAWWTGTPAGPWRALVLGGSRSGKSAEAEARLLAGPEVTYVATGIMHGADAEWQARIDAHRARRPSWWRTRETIDLSGLLRTASGALLIDSLGTWLTGMFDALGAWDYPHVIESHIEDLVDAWRSTAAYVVAVSDEVGLSVVPDSSGGRAFRDALGRLNQRLAAESEQATLVVAGRPMDLP